MPPAATPSNRRKPPMPRGFTAEASGSPIQRQLFYFGWVGLDSQVLGRVPGQSSGTWMPRTPAPPLIHLPLFSLLHDVAASAENVPRIAAALPAIAGKTALARPSAASSRSFFPEA